MHLKKIFNVILILFLAVSLGYSQSSDVIWAKSLKAGNAQEISKYLDKRIELTLNDNGQNYSKEQAQKVIQKFFDQLTITNFNWLHKGNSSGNSTYYIGTLFTKSGNFRTYIFVSNVGNNAVIQEIRFEKQ